MQQLDFWLFKQINTGPANPALDGVMLAASAVGTGAAQAAMGLCFLLYGWIADRIGLRRAGYAGVIAAAASGIAVQLAKSIWGRPRPLSSLYEVRLVGAPLFGNSFPSGHATTAFAVAAAISAFAPGARYVLFPLAVLISVSRVYVGVHFPLDVVYGAALGTLVGMWSASLLRLREGRQREGEAPAEPASPQPSPERRGRREGAASPLTKGGLRGVWPYVLLLAVCLVLFLWRLGAVPLIGLDEGLYSECAREMAAGGSWIVPTVSGQPFYEKPPLAYWLMATSIRAFGATSFAARLPSALAALALVALTVWIGTRLFGGRAGLLGGFALACSIMTAGLARMALLDMLFALVITAALGAFLLSHLGLASRWWYLLFWGATGLSLLVKGPAGAVLIGVTVGVFLSGKWRVESGKHPAAFRCFPLSTFSFPPSVLVAGIAIFVLVAAPWYVLVQRETGGEFLREFVIHQNLQRALGNDFQHNMPFYFYLPTYLVGFFPWSVFVPLAWVRQVRWRPADAAGDASLFAATWIAVMLVIFSISRSKLPAYIYPVYPASALLIGRLWSEAMERGEIDSLRRCAVAAVVTAGIVGSALLIGPRFLPEPVPGLAAALTVMAASFVVGTGLALALLVRRRAASAFGALCAGVVVFMVAAVSLGLPIAARTTAEPAATLGEQLRRITPPDTAVFAYRLSPPQPALAFYAQRAVVARRTPLELREAMRGVGSCVVIGQEGRLDDLPGGGKLTSRQGRYLIYRFGRPPSRR